jgi:LuxR family maltose regulon positive regulatory protein
MTISLLATKLHIPSHRTDLVARPRLVERLRSGVQHPGGLILISGPAGFGKTTLLADFVQGIQQPVAWVSLDEMDNDPVRFWTYVSAALRSVHPEVSDGTLALLHTSQPLPVEAIPTLLINDLVRLRDELVLVLDDYHNLRNPDIHAALSFFLEHQPGNLKLIVSTRVDPPWPLARLRARAQLHELRAADLRFTTEEISTFLNEIMGLNLSAEHVAALEDRTEGWIASLQLAAISMRGRADLPGFIKAFTGSHLYVAEYLIEEVLKRQPDEVNRFLFQTCILERLNARLCDAVTCRADSETVLQDLYRANLFLVPLDDEGHWYRYHHLFADLLKARPPQGGQLAIPAHEISALHRRAMTWFEENGYPGEAMNHALAAKDFEHAAHLLDQHAYSLMTRGELNTLLRWTESLPELVIQSYPALLIKKAWALTLAGAAREVEPLLQHAEAQIGSDERSPHALELRGNAAAMRGFFAMMLGDYPRALDLAKKADAHLPEGNVHVSWLVPYTIGAAHRAEGRYEDAIQAFARQAEMAQRGDNLILWATGITETAIVRRLQGRLREARQICLRALEHISERKALEFGSLAKLEVPLIEVLCEQNELQEAQRRMDSVLQRLQNWSMPTDRIFAHLAQIRVQQAQADLPGAFETLRAAQDLKARHPVLMNLARSVDLAECRWYLRAGDVDSAARLLSELQPGTSRIVSLREQELMLLARLHLARGKPAEAKKIVSPLAREADSGGRNGALIEMLALEAAALYAAGELETALAALTRTLAIGEPQGFMRVFLEEGEAMRELLAAVTRRLSGSADEPSARLRRYARKILDAFPERQPSDLARPAPDGDTRLIEPLTPRELEILQRIAAGDSNRAIADRFVITLSAVKKHAGNIYGKLNVNSRTQAVARARELGLLHMSE